MRDYLNIKREGRESKENMQRTKVMGCKQECERREGRKLKSAS